jgi:hypothetical protein
MQPKAWWGGMVTNHNWLRHRVFSSSSSSYPVQDMVTISMSNSSKVVATTQWASWGQGATDTRGSQWCVSDRQEQHKAMQKTTCANYAGFVILQTFQDRHTMLHRRNLEGTRQCNNEGEKSETATNDGRHLSKNRNRLCLWRYFRSCYSSITYRRPGPPLGSSTSSSRGSAVFNARVSFEC